MQPHLVEQNLAKLLWRGNVELLAGKGVDLGLEGFHAGGEVIRHARQDRRVNRDPGILHIRQNRNQRPFQPLID